MLNSCSKKAASSSSQHALAAADFHTFIAQPGKLNIVDYSASWCPPCQQLKPILNDIADEYSDSVQLGIIDVDQAKKLAAQQGVQGIPDVRFYVNGTMVHKFTGGAPKEHVEQIINNLLAKYDQDLKQPVDPAPDPEKPIQILPETRIETPHPDLVPQPSEPTTPGTPANPSKPTNPTIQPSKENPLPPGMSRG